MNKVDFETLIQDIKLKLGSGDSLEFTRPDNLDFGQQVFWDRLQEKIEQINTSICGHGCCSVHADQVDDETSYAIEFIDEYLDEESKEPRSITMLTFMNSDKSCGVSAIIYDKNKVDCANKRIKKALQLFIKNNLPINNMEIFVGHLFADFECVDSTVSWYFNTEYKEELISRGLINFWKQK